MKKRTILGVVSTMLVLGLVFGGAASSISVQQSEKTSEITVVPTSRVNRPPVQNTIVTVDRVNRA